MGSEMCIRDSHAGGVKEGGTGDETINNVVNFARSNVGNIKKIVSDRGTQFTGETFQRWIQKNDLIHHTSPAYRPHNNQAAESAVKRAKKAILHLVGEHPDLKFNDHEVQSLIHDMAHENMQGQEATAHQALYFSLGQDSGIKVNHRADWLYKE